MNVRVLCEGISTIAGVEYIHPKKKEGNSIIEMFLFLTIFFPVKKLYFQDHDFLFVRFLYPQISTSETLIFTNLGKKLMQLPNSTTQHFAVSYNP